MRSFTLTLHDATRSETIQEVTSFVGEDLSGSFGILAGRARFMTSLVTGLARFRIGATTWKYLAVPGAVLYFNKDQLTVSSRHYLLDEDYMRISHSLKEELLVEEEHLHAIKNSLRQMEEAIFKRLWDINRRAFG